MGGLYGESRFARFHSSRSPDSSKRPRLRVVGRKVGGDDTTIDLNPVIDGYVTVMEQRLITEPGLETYFLQGNDQAAIYARFDLSKVIAEQIESLVSASLILYAESVDNLPQHTLQVFRIHEDNVNTIPFVSGADFERAVLLHGGSSIERRVSTKNRENIQLQYYHQTAKFAEGEYFLVEWFDGEQWHYVRRITRNGQFQIAQDKLPATAVDTEQFAIRMSMVGGDNVLAQADLVRVTGDMMANFD